LDRDTSSLIRGFSKRILPLRVILELFRSASKVHVFQAGLFFFQEILPTRVKHHLSRFPLQFPFEAAIFFFSCSLVSIAWKGFGTVVSSLFAPLMDPRVRNAQLTGNLGTRLATDLGESHRLALKLLRRGLVDCVHDPGSPSGIVYPKLSLLHKSGETSNQWLCLKIAPKMAHMWRIFKGKSRIGT
jgi:hypothetical protein